MRSGAALKFEDKYLIDSQSGHKIAMLSKEMQNVISSWNDRGYKVDNYSLFLWPVSKSLEKMRLLSYEVHRIPRLYFGDIC